MKRFSKKLIYHSAVSGLFFSVFIFGFCMLELCFDEEFEFDFDFLLIACGVAAFTYLLFVLYHILYYKFSGYEITENQIRCKRGVFFKKESILDFSKINSVNKRQGIFQKMFGISVIMVDSGSTTRAHQAEIIIIDDSNLIDELYGILKSTDKKSISLSDTKELMENKIEEDNLYTFSSKRKVAYSFLNSIMYLISALFLFGVMFGILYLAHLYPVEFEEEISFKEVVFFSVLTFGFVLVVGILVNIFKAFVGYYNFKITKSGDTINVGYGLFVNNQNSFNLNMVRGVLISQGIFQRVFKLATIKVEVVGYLENSNNNKGVIGILIPLCKLNEVDDILKRIIPTHIPVKQEGKSKAFFPFITWNTFISFVTAALCAILATGISLAFNSTIALIASTSAIGGMFVIYEIIMIISSAIAYHSQDISFEEKTITLYNGSLIKCATVIKKEDIIAIEDVTTPFRKKKGIYSYIIHFHTNAYFNTKKINIVDESFRELLINCMKY